MQGVDGLRGPPNRFRGETVFEADADVRKYGRIKPIQKAVAYRLPYFIKYSLLRGLQNAMTSSEERTSAESRGLPHREGTDGLRRPP